jgi:hypothetical protein
VIAAPPPPVYPWPIGVGQRYHPSAAGRPSSSLRCASGGRTFAVHVELFAGRKVVVVPPGIGSGRRCLSTTEPTGIVHVAARGRYTLGDLFRVWGRRLRPGALLSFTGRVRVYLGGRPRRGEPGAVPLAKHAQIVVEIGGYVAPHPSYLFPKGVG